MSDSLQPVQQLQYGYAGNQPYSGFYRHSGKVTLRGTALAVLAGLAVAVVTGYLYGYADLYMPIVYGNVLLCLAFGGAIGFVAARVMRWGKVRNTPVSLAIVGVLTLAAYYVCWATWEIAVLDRFNGNGPVGPTLPFLLRSPQVIYRLAVLINEVGTWTTSTSTSSSSGSTNEHGVMLLIVWIAEAGLIFGTALMIAKTFATDRPFCERCDDWCQPGVAVKHLNPTGAAGLRDRLANRNWPELLEHTATPAVGSHWVELVHHKCAKCDGLHTITAVERRVTVDKRGRKNEKKKVLVNMLLMSGEEVAYLRALGREPEAPAAAAATTA